MAKAKRKRLVFPFMELRDLPGKTNFITPEIVDGNGYPRLLYKTAEGDITGTFHCDLSPETLVIPVDKSRARYVP